MSGKDEGRTSRDRINATVRLYLGENGLYEIINGSWKFSFNSDEEVVRYFSPHAITRNNAYQIIGHLGYYVPQFENQWLELCVRAGIQVDNRDCLFALLITKIPSFMSPPLFSRTEPYDTSDWIDRIIAKMKELPAGYQGLLDLTHRGFQGIFTLERFYCHPVKVYAFKRWCKSVNLNLYNQIKVSLPIQRVAPYERLLEAIVAENG